MVSDLGEVRDRISMTNAPKSVAGSLEKTVINLENKTVLLRGLTALISSGRCASSEDIVVGCLKIICRMIARTLPEGTILLAIADMAVNVLNEFFSVLTPVPISTPEEYDGWQYRWKSIVFRPACNFIPIMLYD